MLLLCDRCYCLGPFWETGSLGGQQELQDICQFSCCYGDMSGCQNHGVINILPGVPRYQGGARRVCPSSRVVGGGEGGGKLGGELGIHP